MTRPTPESQLLASVFHGCVMDVKIDANLERSRWTQTRWNIHPMTNYNLQEVIEKINKFRSGEML